VTLDTEIPGPPNPPADGGSTAPLTDALTAGSGEVVVRGCSAFGVGFSNVLMLMRLLTATMNPQENVGEAFPNAVACPTDANGNCLRMQCGLAIDLLCDHLAHTH
jgi:hypothetical protein